MVDSWEEALERGESVGVLLLDLSAAFDTLDPPLLLEKLKRLNFSNNTVNWIKSFMSTWSQRVRWEDHWPMSCERDFFTLKGE
jgi:hypothetical protein